MKKNIKKYLSAIISFVMLLNLTTLITYSSQPLDVIDTEPITVTEAELILPEILTPDAVAGKGHVLRVTDMEDELNTATFQNIDGSYSTYVFGEPIKYIDNNGNVNDKSNALIQTLVGFSNVKNDIRVSYPNNIAMGITARYGDYNIRMTPIIPDGASAGSGVLGANDGSTVSDKVTYSGVFGSGTRVEYTQTFAGFKEIIILENDVGISDFSFNLITGGLYIEERGGKLALVDPSTDSTAATLGSLVIWDSEYNYYPGEYSFETVKANSAYTVTVSCDSINTEDIQYPLYIDPPILFQHSETVDAIYDINPYSCDPNNSEDEVYYPDTSSDTLYIGKTGGGNSPTARALVKIQNLTSIQNIYNNSDNIIYSVSYSFGLIMCSPQGSASAYINAHLCSQNWNDATVPSAPYYEIVGDFLDAEVLYYKYGGDQTLKRHELNITKAVYKWMTGEPNYGIMIKLNSDQDAIVMIGSSEAGITGGLAANAPYVVVNYATAYDNLIFKIKQAKTDKYLSVENGYAYTGQTLKVLDDDSANPIEDQLWNQDFRFTDETTADTVYIRPLCSYNGKIACLGATSTTSSSAVITCDVNDTDTSSSVRKFKIIQLSPGEVRIALSDNNNLVLTANSDGSVTLAPNTWSDNQRWKLEFSEANIIEDHYADMDIEFPFEYTSTLNATSDFGYRSGGFHGGLDLSATSTTELKSLFDGEVVDVNSSLPDRSNPRWSRGYFVTVEATDPEYYVYGDPNTKLKFVYMHLKERARNYDYEGTNIDYLSVGEKVTAGQTIGIAGKTGKAEGIHLHISIIIDGDMHTSDPENCMDPLLLFSDITFTHIYS